MTVNGVVNELQEAALHDIIDQGDTKTISITAPNIDAATDAYYPFVTTGTFENAQGSNIDHFDAIGSVTITDPGLKTVANNSATTNIEHQISITDDSSFNNIDWTL
jgi:hypothetical protein